MTLIAGFRCRDGFVIAADTEMTMEPIISFQGHKLADYYDTSNVRALVVAYSGDVGYAEMASQKIRDAVQALSSPTLADIKGHVETVVGRIYEDHLFKLWKTTGREEPYIELIVGVEDQKREFGVLRTRSTSVSEVQHHTFAGSGAYLAEHLAERLLASSPVPMAVTEHLVRQIFREIKGKGAYVGGNTEIVARRSSERAAMLFSLPKEDRRFLWGLEANLLSAVRIALDQNKPDKLLESRLRFIRRTLKRLKQDSQRLPKDVGDERHSTEFGTEYGNPYKDL